MGWEDDRLAEINIDNARRNEDWSDAISRRQTEEENRLRQQDIERWENTNHSCDSVNDQTSSGYQDSVQQSYTDKAWQEKCWQETAAADAARYDADAAAAEQVRQRIAREQADQQAVDGDLAHQRFLDGQRDINRFLEAQRNIRNSPYETNIMLDEISDSQFAIDRQIREAKEANELAQQAWMEGRFTPAPLVE